MKRSICDFILFVLIALVMTACAHKNGDERVVNAVSVPVRELPVSYEIKDGEGNPMVGEDISALLDNRPESVWEIGETRTVILHFASGHISAIRLKDAGGLRLSLFADKQEGAPIAVVDDSTARIDGWIDIPVNRIIEKLVLHVEALQEGAHVAHIEFWKEAEFSLELFEGLEDATVERVISKKDSSAVVRFPAQVENGDNTAKGRITLSIPRQYRRTYVLYEAMGAFRPVSAFVKVNDCDWLGGLSIPEQAGSTGILRTHALEINPRWLSEGDNTIHFRGNSDDFTLKALSLVAVKDTGYNEPIDTPGFLHDGDTSTATVLPDEGALCAFERPMRVYGALVYIKKGSVRFVYRRGGEWVSAGNVGAETAGWHYASFSTPFVADTVKLYGEGEGGAEIAEIAFCASPQEPLPARIVVSYPRDGEYFTDTAYLEGFVEPFAAKNGTTLLSVDGKQVSSGVSGGFSAEVKKRESGAVWEIPLKATYSGGMAETAKRFFAPLEVKVVEKVLKLAGPFSPYAQSSSGTAGSTGGGSGGDGSGTVWISGQDALNVKVSPESAQSVYHRGVEIRIPKGAVESETVITIIPLKETELAPLTPGMRNVTAPAAGYRFLFNGKAHGTFKKAITISIPYETSKLLSGTSEREVRMFYYDEAKRIWKRMEESRVVTKQSPDFALYARASASGTSASGCVVTESTHFTDFINATLSVPEHPDALSFNPNSIKDIKAGEPLAGMELIKAPEPGNTGDAGIRFPIVLPKGRAGLQPQLELRYGQQGGAGLCGLGWSLQVSSIGIDTRWGAARYDGSDVFSLDGSQLVPVGNNMYRTRVEGGFAKIIKHDNHWEVIHKNGMRALYGESANARLSSAGKTGQWFLEWMIDPHGNSVHYTYYHDTGTLPESSASFVQVYMDRIYYTGYGRTDGPFTVEFVREAGRTDKQIDGRMGFLTFTRLRYSGIRVTYGGSLIRSYEMTYREGAFYKSLLSAVRVKGSDGSMLHHHDFDYYDEVGWGGSELNLFDPPVAMEGAETIEKEIYNKNNTIGLIGGSYSEGRNSNGTVGFAPFNYQNAVSVGKDVSNSSSESKTILSLIDINGDGLPDQLYQKGDSFYFRANYFSDNKYRFGYEKKIEGLHGLGYDTNSSDTKGKGINLYYAGYKKQKSSGKAYTQGYFSDVNGDGFVDYIDNTVVWYNHAGWNEGGEVSFSTTPPPDVSIVEHIDYQIGTVNTEDGEEGEPKYEFLEYYFRDNPVLAWRAPFTGNVHIKGGIKISPSMVPPDNYTSIDGVRVSIQRNSEVLWQGEVFRNAESIYPTSCDNIQVKQGDYILFRIDSNKDGAYDEISWDPEVAYAGVNLETVDENNLYVYRYKLSDDFLVTQDPGIMIVPVSGEIRINGNTVRKTDRTSDDVRVKIIHRIEREITDLMTRKSQKEIIEEKEILSISPIAAVETGEFELPDTDLSVKSEIQEEKDSDGNVVRITTVKSVIECRLESDTPIDWRQIKWQPCMRYVEVEGDEQSPLKDMAMSLPVGRPIYAIMGSNSTGIKYEYTEGWDVPKEGTYKIRYTVKNNSFQSKKITLCIKKRVNGEGFVTSVVDTVINEVGSGDERTYEYEMDFSEEESLFFLGVADALDGIEVSADVYYSYSYGGDPFWVYVGSPEMILYRKHNPAEDISFSGGFHNWFYGRWNADYVFNAQTPETVVYNYPFSPLETEKMIIDTNGDMAEQILLCSAMMPMYDRNTNDTTATTIPPVPCYKGMDGDSWIGPGKFATSRVMKDNIEELLSNNAVFRMEKNEIVIKTVQKLGSVAFDRRGVIKYTRSKGEMDAPSMAGQTFTYSRNESVTKADFFDINGDRYPDVVTDVGVCFSKIDGSLSPQSGSITGSLKIVNNFNKNLSINPLAMVSMVNTKPSGDSDEKKQKLEFSFFPSGVTGALAAGDSHTIQDYIDINGDGLPDRVRIERKNYSINYSININTGYGLNPAYAMGTPCSALIAIGNNTSMSANMGMGFGCDKAFISGGLAIMKNESNATEIGGFGFDVDLHGFLHTQAMLLDINGDGLPDIIRKGDSDSQVYINTGSEFFWNTKTIINTFERSNGRSFSISGSGGVKIPITLPIIGFLGTIMGDVGSGTNKDFSRTTSSLRDMNGDGLVDLVNESGGKIMVRFNRTGKTNMLKAVRNSLGGKIELDYARLGNTKDMPQSQWVLAKVTTSDGASHLDGDAGSIHSYTTAYEYTGGMHDRKNREFLGFALVAETHADGSRTEKEYRTDSYYTKGLAKRETVKDASGRIFVLKEYEYEIDTIFPKSTLWLYEVKFPKRVKETATYYEGKSQGVAHSTRYAYDAYGNVTTFLDEGDPSTLDDDVKAEIVYAYNESAWIMDRPQSIAVKDASGKLLRHRLGTYDAKGSLTRLRIFGTPSGYATYDFTYDAYGNLVMFKEPENHLGQRYWLSYTYDDAVKTYIVKTTDALGYTSTASFDVRFGNPNFTKDINGTSFQYSYDCFGRLTRLWGPYDMESGRAAIEVKYLPAILDGEGKIVRPQGTITYNRSGGGYNETVTVVRYADGLGRELSVKTSACVDGKFGFTASGAKRYDGMGRVIAEGKPAFFEGESLEYAPVLMRHPAYFEYDCMGRKVKITYPDGGEVETGYVISGTELTETIIDQEGGKKKICRDVRGNIVKVCEYEGKYFPTEMVTRYAYNPINEITKVIDAKGNVTSVEYDALGRRTAIDNPDAGRTNFWYDDAGNLIGKQTAKHREKNAWIRYVYHFHQLKMIDNPESDDVYFEYGDPGAANHAAGRIVKEYTGKLVDEYQYGALGEVVKKFRTIEGTKHAITYRWDNFGRMRSVAYSNGFGVSYAYDTGAQVRGATGWLGSEKMIFVKEIRYDEYGSRTRIEYGNGAVTEFGYDDLMHRLVSLKTVSGGSILQNIAYSYDKVGNILTRSENGVVTSSGAVKNIAHTYHYDTLYRLTEAEGTITENGKTVHSYSNEFAYSEIGNIMRKIQSVYAGGVKDGSLTYDYTYHYTTPRPHAVSKINDNLTYRYDANGNMIAIYDTAKNFNRVLYWDDENRLTKSVDSTNGGSVATEYAYDTKGMRIIKDGPYGKSIYVDTGYIESGTSRASAPAMVSNHVFVGNTRIASVVKHKEEPQAAMYFYASDHLGSSSVLTNQQGSYHERIEYLPYGEVWVEDAANSNSYTTPYKFTGKELDKETNLYYFGARYYDARLSRWISTDPALQEGKYFPKPNDYDTEHDFYWYILNDASGKLPGMGGIFNPLNINSYQYALNNPTKITDPDGKAALPVVIVGVIVKLIWDVISTPREMGDIIKDKNGNIHKVGDTDSQYAGKIIVSCVSQAIGKEIGNTVANKVFEKAKKINAFRATTRGGEIYRIRQIEDVWDKVGVPFEKATSFVAEKTIEKTAEKLLNTKNNEKNNIKPKSNL